MHVKDDLEDHTDYLKVSVYVDNLCMQVLKSEQDTVPIHYLCTESTCLLLSMPRQLQGALHLNSSPVLEQRWTVSGTFEVRSILACVPLAQLTGALAGTADNGDACATTAGSRMVA